MTDADARSERRRPGTRLIGNCGQYRRAEAASEATLNSEPAPSSRGRRDLSKAVQGSSLCAGNGLPIAQSFLDRYAVCPA